MNWTAYIATLTWVLVATLWWPLLSKLGQDLGWALARPQIEAKRREARLAEIQYASALRYSRVLAGRSSGYQARSHGLAQHIGPLHHYRW